MLYWGIVYKERMMTMPYYEYRCNKCGEDFEKMLRFSESDNNPICPKCESADTHKKISRVAALVNTTTGSTASSCAPRGGFS
jgi:putative FmdB family regulatory protein